MRLCFLNGWMETEQEVFERLLDEHICRQGVDVFVLGKRIRDDHVSLKTLIRIKVRYPNVKVYLLTHVLPEKQTEKAPLGFDGFWYPSGLNMKPARLARRLAGCLTIDQALFMIDGGYGKAGLPGLLSAYAIRRSRLGQLTVTRISRIKA